MASIILFSERQRFRQWWILAILFGVNILFVYGCFTQIIGGKQFGNEPLDNNWLLVVTGVSFLVTLLMMSSRLDTLIKSDGIYIRFFPFHLKFKHIPWDSLDEAFIRKYSPLTEYGGWGLRFSIFGRGTAYNVSGDEGLQLIFKNGKKLLIGTQRAGELSAALERARGRKKD